jgi:hypothetical protein
VIPLDEIRKNPWKAMNSLVHGGIHPRQRIEASPVEFAAQVVRNSNGISHNSLPAVDAACGATRHRLGGRDGAHLRRIRGLRSHDVRSTAELDARGPFAEVRLLRIKAGRLTTCASRSRRPVTRPNDCLRYRDSAGRQKREMSRLSFRGPAVEPTLR